ncbi:unnamed protein product [Effrenium voratum]|nr:unnamed protein product [Effrenium voratum]
MGETRFGSNRRETLREQFSRLKEILRKFQGALSPSACPVWVVLLRLGTVHRLYIDCT